MKKKDWKRLARDERKRAESLHARVEELQGDFAVLWDIVGEEEGDREDGAWYTRRLDSVLHSRLSELRRLREIVANPEGNGC